MTYFDVSVQRFFYSSNVEWVVTVRRYYEKQVLLSNNAAYNCMSRCKVMIVLLSRVYMECLAELRIQMNAVTIRIPDAQILTIPVFRWLPYFNMKFAFKLLQFQYLW